MVPVALSDVIAVGENPTVEELAILAKAGFRSILNSLPDGEVARHLRAAELEKEAKGCGLGYAYVPTDTRRPDEATIKAFQAAAASLPKPIFACCYSGSRSAALWALAVSPTAEPDAIIKACAAAGYDIAFLRDELAERRAGQEPTRLKVAAAMDAEANRVAALDAATPAPAAPKEIFIPAKPVATEPALLPNPIVVPRAASVGGFAVPG